MLLFANNNVEILYNLFNQYKSDTWLKLRSSNWSLARLPRLLAFQMALCERSAYCRLTSFSRAWMLDSQLPRRRTSTRPGREARTDTSATLFSQRLSSRRACSLPRTEMSSTWFWLRFRCWSCVSFPKTMMSTSPAFWRTSRCKAAIKPRGAMLDSVFLETFRSTSLTSFSSLLMFSSWLSSKFKQLRFVIPARADTSETLFFQRDNHVSPVSLERLEMSETLFQPRSSLTRSFSSERKPTSLSPQRLSSSRVSCLMFWSPLASRSLQPSKVSCVTKSGTWRRFRVMP
ncbi:Hypothetical_protein [Hexamita inflata]|uniref:Hypothetical_protein n=2 Tax=Hexamita inflata TaxID=28002 RepID=A0AA86TKV0_9EUKA|nr:Hypothetical protein HINF_LOCUS8113 [Hexamita inflata]CAI9920470.1 Hypothetical protein HINF_LOCUS8115 [Hexamita inflata]